MPRCVRCWMLGALLLILAGVLLAQTAATPGVGDSAPDFSRESLHHQPVRLAASRGHVVLLNFWASWCEPCLAELPQFVAWQREYGTRGLQIVGVSMDDTAPPALAAAQKYRLNYPVVMGDVQLARRYGGIYGVPVTLLIDRRGRIEQRDDGAANLPQLQHAIELLLRKHSAD